MILDGSIAQLGAGFLLTMRLVSADSGRELASYRESVDSPGALITAVGKLTRRLRAQIGESLRDVQGSPRLEAVTTTSLDALRRYSEGLRALTQGGDRPAFMRLMHEAIALDSSFAIAYSALATELNNRGGRDAEASALINAGLRTSRAPPGARAADHRGELLQIRSARRARRREIICGHARRSGRSRGSWTVAQQRRGELRVDNKPVQAESVYRLAIAHDTMSTYPIGNLLNLMLREGRAAEAESLLQVYNRRFPRNGGRISAAAALLERRGLSDSGEAMLRKTLAATSDPFARTALGSAIAAFAGEGGRIRDVDAAAAIVADARRARGIASAGLVSAIDRARYYALVAGDRPHALRLLDSATAGTALNSIEPAERPYADLTSAYAEAGNPVMARRYLPELEKQTSERDLGRAYELRLARARVAIAERRWNDAIREAGNARMGKCVECADLPLALAYDGRGDRDSAIAAFERSQIHAYPDEDRGPVLRRLGELYEARDDVRNAIDRFQKFVTLWKRADPELQPQVAEVKKKIALLQATEARAR